MLEFESDGVINLKMELSLESDLTMFISAGTGHHILKESGMPLSDAGFVVTI